MRLAIAASEAAPFIKTGGLGDVLQALPQALSELRGNEVYLFLPYYGAVKHADKWETEFLGSFDVSLAWRREYVGVFRLKSRRKKLQIYFIDNEHYFNRDGIYGFGDDGERFAFFSKAVLASIRMLKLEPEVISCHDWQTALIPLLMKTEFAASFGKTRSVFTIHNIEYQGKCGMQFNYDVLGLPAACDEILRFDDCVNFMKSAIVTADRVSTVSETYAKELQYPYYAHGLSGVLLSRGADFTGITNGIDMTVYDPGAKGALTETYGPDTLRAGKTANKLALQARLGLPARADVPMLAMVTRLAGHKGIDLLCYIAERLVQRDVQLVLIGTGEEKYEWYLSSLHERFPDRVSVNLLFDPKLAIQVYAASDLYLMPSKSEPCGLSQLIAMRYGSVPVVNATGGLKDTVPPFDPADGSGRGFTFQSYNADDFLAAIDRALELYEKDPEAWLRLAQNDMRIDSSWRIPAQKYMELFQPATKG